MRRLVVDNKISSLGGAEKFISNVRKHASDPTSYYYVLKAADRIFDYSRSDGATSQPSIPGLYFFLENKRTVLAPTEELFISLINTKFHNIKLSEIQIPYPSFYLVLPRKAFSIDLFLPDSAPPIREQIHPFVEGILATQTEAGSTEFLVIPDWDDDDKAYGVWPQFWFNFSNASGTFLETMESLADEYKGGDFSNPQKFFGDILSILINFLLFYSLPKQMAVDVVDDEYAKTFALLEGKKSTQKVAKAQKRLDRLSPSNVILVTPKDVDRTNYIHKLKPTKESTYNSECARKNMRRHIVAGHWHHYHTKDGLELRWVMPYWKGDSGLGFVSKTNIIS